MENAPFEDVFPVKKGIFHCYISLPEGTVIIVFLGNSHEKYLQKIGVEEYNPYWQKSITEQYTSLSTSLPGSELVPVGPAWQRARELRGTLPLYDADQSHPSALGQYLTACVFYSVFTKKSPLGLPNRLTCEDRTGEKIYLNIQAETGRPVRYVFYVFFSRCEFVFCWMFGVLILGPSKKINGNDDWNLTFYVFFFLAGQPTPSP